MPFNSYIFACALCIVAPTAEAADLSLNKAPARAVAQDYNWSGVYITGYGEYAVNIDPAILTVATTPITLGGVQKGPGFGGGLQALYQSAGSDWVLGVRATIGYANLQGSGGTPGLTLSSATNYMGDFNAVVGYTFSPRLLGYVTGGLAFGGAKPNLTVTTVTAAASDTSVGWDVGAGLAYALTNNWSIFIEGDYKQLGNKSLSLGPAITSSNPFNFFEQKIGINFKL